MTLKIAINGFGRIGRSVFRALLEHPQKDQFEIVAINELANADHVAHLLQFDSVHGTLSEKISIVSDAELKFLIYNTSKIRLLQHQEIDQLPWHQLNVDIVFECTGQHANYNTAFKHVQAGAGKVLLSQPAKDKVDNTVVFGFNEDSIKGDQIIVSNASCTSNCLVPILKIIDDFAGINHGSSTTIHAAMADQAVNDSYAKQIHLSRSAMQSIIPVPTELAIGITKFFPKLEGKFETLALRVPTVNVSLIDLTIELKKSLSVESIKQHLIKISAQKFPGIVDVTDLPLVSVDYNHNPHSVTVDLSQLRLAANKQLKLLLWFDNEWGFANRMLDTALLMMKNSERY